jgi:hypothetical protein
MVSLGPLNFTSGHLYFVLNQPSMKNVEFYHCRNARVDSHCCKYVLCGPCYVSLSGRKRRSRMVDQNAVVHQIIDGCSHTDQETFHRAIHACYILDEMMDGCCGKCGSKMKELMYGGVEWPVVVAGWG